MVEHYTLGINTSALYMDSDAECSTCLYNDHLDLDGKFYTCTFSNRWYRGQILAIYTTTNICDKLSED